MSADAPAISSDRERAITRIKKLQQMTFDNGCTPELAASAAAKVQKLLHEYQLTLLDVDSKTLNDPMQEQAIDTGRKRRNAGEGCLASAIAHGFDCYLINDPYRKTYHYLFLGYASDTEVASYVFESVLRQLNEQAEKEGRKLGFKGPALIRFRNSFFWGAASEIRRRLAEQKQAQKATATGTALVLVKGPAVTDFVRRQHPKLQRGPDSRIRLNHLGLSAGRAAGRSVNLNRAVPERATPALPG